MNKHKRLLAFLLAFTLLFSAAGCAKKATTPIQPDNNTHAVQEQVSQGAVQAPLNQETKPEQQQETKPEQLPTSSDTVQWPDEKGYYYDVESVVLYLHTYGKLPSNYIKKAAAEKLGWEGGSVEKYKEGAAIGGDNFGNREGLLPKANGRKFTECDIDTKGAKSRGAKRLIFSNDGLYFYTDDHYESFTELTVDENNKIVWKK